MKPEELLVTTCKYVLDVINQEGTSEQKLERVILFCEKVVVDINNKNQ
jgi:hypothetical protein